MMNKLFYAFIFILFHISVISHANTSAERSQTSDDVIFCEIPEYSYTSEDIRNIPFESEKTIKMFIYRNMVNAYGIHGGIIRLMREADFSFFKKELEECEKHLKTIESGKLYISIGDCEPIRLRVRDELDYSISYMMENKICCIRIGDFVLPTDVTILDIPAGYFRGFLDAGGEIHRFKKIGSFWYYIGVKHTWRT